MVYVGNGGCDSDGVSNGGCGSSGGGGFCSGAGDSSGCSIGTVVVVVLIVV